jgi:hypothetical protein
MNIYSVVGFSFLGAEGMIGICDLRGFFFPISFDIENLVNQSFSKKIENLVKYTIENKISPKFSLFFGVK